MKLTRDILLDHLHGEYVPEAESLGPDEPLFSSRLLDSFVVLELINYLERETGLRIPSADITLENLDTVARIVRYVEGRLEA